MVEALDVDAWAHYCLDGVMYGHLVVDDDSIQIGVDVPGEARV